jgi:hypothetical protein
LIDDKLGNKTTSDVLMALWFAFNRTAALKAYVPGMLPTSFTHRGPLALFIRGMGHERGCMVEGVEPTPPRDLRDDS